MKLLHKRAQVGNLAGFFMGIGVAAIILVVVMIIVQELQVTAEQTTNASYTSASATPHTAAAVAAAGVVTKLATAPTWIGLIILAGLAFIVLGFFMGRRGE